MGDAPTLTKELRDALLHLSHHPMINLPPKMHIDMLIGRGYVEQRLGAAIVTNKGFALLRRGARRLPPTTWAASQADKAVTVTLGAEPMATVRNGKKAPKFNARSFLATTGAKRTVYPPAGTLFAQGAPADAVFYIQKGKVQITILSDQGKEGMIAILGAGEFFGEGCLAGQPLHLATARAMSDASVVKIRKDVMIRMLREEPTFSEVFMTFLLSRNVTVEAELVDHLFNSSEKRLARILLLLANFGKEGKLEPIPKVSQEALAARVGTTRSRVNFFMNKFKKLGLIEYNGHIKVHSALLNVIVHDD